MEFALLPSTAPGAPTQSRANRRDRSRFAFEPRSFTFFPFPKPAPSISEWDIKLPSYSSWFANENDHEEWTAVAASSRTFDALAKIRSFAKYGENWDGEGSLRPSVEAIDLATKLLGALIDASTEIPSVGMTPDGNPMLIYMTESLEGEIIVHGSGVVEYCFDGDDSPCDEFKFDGGALPGELTNYLSLV